MLDLAIKYKEQLEYLSQSMWFNEKYKYWNSSVYYDVIVPDNTTWDRHQFVSAKDGRVIGYISYQISRHENIAHSLSIINFTDDIVTFGLDLGRALKDIFEKFHFYKLAFFVIVGNPVEKTYDRMIERYGGHIVGIMKKDVKLIDNQYYDKKMYEIFEEEYFNAIKKKGDKDTVY